MDRVKILVVDDEEEICNISKSFLFKRGYDVFTALNQAEALNLVESQQPQVVLLDVRLGAESGMDVLRKIKESNKNIKVIMVTALDDEASIRQARSLGADDYVAKPFTAAYLNDLILQKISSLSAKQVKSELSHENKDRKLD